MAYHMSTKERLLSIVDDIEIISKEIIENILAPKSQKLSPNDHSQLIKLLVSKDNDIHRVLKLAGEQAIIEQQMDLLRAQVEIQDQEINELQAQLKNAEHILATALFQARLKLASIAKANKRPVSSEELIKYAHRISSSHAVCAPLTWQQGDLRRPYPTDIEMRIGFLGKSDLNFNSSVLPNQNAMSCNDIHRNPATGEIPTTAQNQFSWHPSSGELHMSMGSSASAGSVSLDTRAHKDATQDDVEVMSTDSSSSSSSSS